MFTGIIQEIGTITKIDSSTGKDFTVQCKDTLQDLKIGDSVAINGACQTVTKFDSHSFSFYSSTETLAITNLNLLKIKDQVNLEKPLSLNTLLDGHLVQGHVDGMAVVDSIVNKQGEYHIKINCPQEQLRYMIHKGSVAVNGVSLTINELYDNGFLLTIIPVTFEKSNFKYFKNGDKVNIEVDLFSKYVERLLKGGTTKTKIDENFLSKHGFL